MTSMLQVKLNTNYLIASLAIVFVVYHLSQMVMAPINLGGILNAHSTAPVVQHKLSPTTDKLPAVEPVLRGLDVNQESWPTRVVIPSADIDLPLEGSIEKAGEWTISETGANFALNSSIPNKFSGNTVLFGHDRPKLFRNIHQLKQGDAINVVSPEGTYTYKLMSTTVVTPSDISVMDQTDKPMLTLLTCDGWLSQNRYVVIAQFDHFAPSM